MHTKESAVAESCFAYMMGAGVYSLLEVAWRGHTHWTMTLTGGFCALALWWIAGLLLPFPIRCLLSAGAITLAELAVGCVVNLLLGMGVWDYSAKPLNLLGQICLPYAGLWFLLSAFALPLCAFLRKRLFG